MSMLSASKLAAGEVHGVWCSQCGAHWLQDEPVLPGQRIECGLWGRHSIEGDPWPGMQDRYGSRMMKMVLATTTFQVCEVPFDDATDIDGDWESWPWQPLDKRPEYRVYPGLPL